MKRFPKLAPFEFDFSITEIPLQRNWVNGRPLYQIAVQLTGGNGTSTAASNLHNIIQSLIDATWAGFVIGSGWFANAGTTANGITIDSATGLITVSHTGVNLTGELVFCTLDYTKI